MLFVLQRNSLCSPSFLRLAFVARLKGARLSSQPSESALRTHIHRPHITRRTFAFTSILCIQVTKYLIGANETSPGDSVSSDSLPEPNATPVTEEVKHAATRLRRWQRRLTTFEQFKYESDIDAFPSQGKRLLDVHRIRRDATIWIELLQFRRRTLGPEGIIPLWNRLKNSSLLFGTNVLQCGVLELGFQNPEVLEEVFQYAEDRYRKKDFRCSHLYYIIVGHLLQIEPRKAYYWHTRLKNSFAPSDEEFKQMFRQINAADREVLAVFERIYADIICPQMYSTVIPSLCDQKLYDSALRWHKALVANGDFPSSYLYAQPLLHELASRGWKYILLRCTTDLVNGGVSFPESTSQTLKTNTVISREMADSFYAKFYGFAPRSLSDDFCARLFATRAFSVGTVMKGLQILGFDVIGPMALREIAARAITDGMCSSEIVVQHLSTLRHAGISIGNSVLSRLIEKLAFASEDRILADAINCDLHPEAFEDWKLQEKLLASYIAKGDQLQADRTLAVLLLDSKARHRTPDHWNILFRTCLTQRHWRGMHQILETMREQKFSLSSKSCKYLRECVLTPRQVSKGPSTTDDLCSIINIWQWKMCAGGYILPKAWIEILRRLGMTGQLVELEKLAFWLARWYTDSTFQASQVETGINMSYRNRLTDLPPRRHPLHPCNIIFTKSFVQSVVAWGFRHSPGMIQYSKLTFREQKSINASNEAPWMWGLQLLKKLKACNVYIERKDVARSCRLRLKIMFGPGLSRRRVNRLIQKTNKSGPENYVDAMKHIWGQDLFISLKPRESIFLGNKYSSRFRKRKMAGEVTYRRLLLENLTAH